MEEKEFQETDVLNLKERKFTERVEEFDIKEKRLKSIEKEMETTERGLDSAREELMVKKELRMKETELVSVREKLREKERNLDSAKKEIKLKDKSVDAMKKKLELQEQELTSLKKKLQLREGELNSIKKEFRQHLEELDCKKKILDLVSVSMQNSDCEFQLERENFQKEQEVFKKRMEDIALKEKQVEVRCRELTQREKHIDNRFKLLEEKEKQMKTLSSAPVNAEPSDYAEMDRVCTVAQLEECLESLARHETQLKQIIASTCPSETKETLTDSILKADCTCNSNNYITSEIPQLGSGEGGIYPDSFAIILTGMGGKNLQIFLNDHCEEHELLRVEVSRGLKKSTDSRMLVLEALGGFYPTEPHKEEIECDRTIIRKSCILLLEELMRISPFLAPKAKLEAGKLASDWKTKMTAEIDNHLVILGFLFLVGAYGLASGFDKNELESLCSTVGAQHGLRTSVINGEPLSINMEKRSQLRKGSIIPLLSDPAKIVLDALRKCYSAEGQQLRELTKKRKRMEVFYVKRFSDLLEQLRRVSPEIKPQVKIEATEFAVAWRTTLTGSWEVLGFFNFLATYGLSSLFDSDDLLGLLEMVQDIKSPINLIKILGIADKIPCFIEKRIQRRQWLQALPYVYEFELVDLFPPVPLLKNYVSDATDQAKQICGDGRCSGEARQKAVICELFALRAVVEHIVLHDLQSEYSPDPHRARISELEREMANLSAPNQPIPQVHNAVKKQKI